MPTLYSGENEAQPITSIDEIAAALPDTYPGVAMYALDNVIGFCVRVFYGDPVPGFATVTVFTRNGVDEDTLSATDAKDRFLAIARHAF